MRNRLMAGVAAFLALTACASLESGPQGAPQATAEPLDPFVVAIDAERWTVLLERAVNGAIEAPTKPGQDEDDRYRADAALKQAAAQAIYLRNVVCGKGLVNGAACKLPDFPAWTREAPTSGTSLEELQRRSDWISGMIAPFVDAGCAAGKKATGEEMFCSVE